MWKRPVLDAEAIMPVTPKPLAVGLVGHRPGDSELTRSRRRVALASWAHREGYTLLETFETHGGQVDDLVIIGVEEFAERSGASVVLICGTAPCEPYGPTLVHVDLRE